MTLADQIRQIATELFPDNLQEEITAADMRQFANQVADAVAVVDANTNPFTPLFGNPLTYVRPTPGAIDYLHRTYS
jgi:hypothetical protein